MFSITTAFAASLLLASQVYGHGYISSPASRSSTIGDAFGAACGSTLLSQQSSDKAGNIQGELQVASSLDASECNLWLCKGFKFEDNAANVQSFTAGQSVDFAITIVAPHTGVANVSVVDTATNTVIGEPLISFEDYASTATGVTDDETSFSVTIPDGLDQCSEAGACVLQWYWNSPEVDQTYEDCVDFTVGGSGSTTPEPSSSEPATSASESAAVPSSSAAAPSEPATTESEEVSSAAPTSTEAASSSVPATTSAAESSAVESESAPATSASASATTSVSAVPSSSAAAPSTSAAATTSVATPTTSAAASASPAPTSGSCSKDAYNCCMDSYNTCLDALNNGRTTGGSVDFSSCEAERDTCLSSVSRRHAREFFLAV